MSVRMALGLVVAVCVVLLSAATSVACTLIPWDYTDLVSDETVRAMIHGTVTHVEEGGRVATLSVASYVGQGKGPREVHVGPTEYSGSREFQCPDSSVIFQEQQAYLVFLSEGSPTFKLAYPKLATAIPVNSYGMVALRQDSDQNEPVHSVMQAFGRSHNLPVHNGGKWSPSPSTFIAVLVLLGVGLLTWSRFRRSS